MLKAAGVVLVSVVLVVALVVAGFVILTNYAFNDEPKRSEDDAGWGV